MSMYENLTSDFSNRCTKIMNWYYADTIDKEHSITFLLMIATSAFVIPHEKLNHSKSPSGKQYSSETGKDINNSFLKEIATSDIRYGFLKEINDDPDTWATDGTDVGDKKVSEFLSIIRNALSHGNIYVIETKPKSNTIGKIAFLSENRKDSGKCESCKTKQRILNPENPYKFLIFPVDTFQKFLEIWLSFLKNDIDEASKILDELGV